MAVKGKPFHVVYEDNHIIIVNKSSGILVQGDKSGDKPLVELVRDYIKKKYDKQGNVFCGTVHRIDRPVNRPFFCRLIKDRLGFFVKTIVFGHFPITFCDLIF